jgi:hypothetical protein
MKSGVKFFEREHIELVREANHSYWDFFSGSKLPLVARIVVIVT